MGMTNTANTAASPEVRSVVRRYQALARLGYCNLCPADQNRSREMAAWLRSHGVNPARIGR